MWFVSWLALCLALASAIGATMPPIVLDVHPTPVVGLSLDHGLIADYRDPNGLSDLQVVYLDVETSGGGAPHSCFIAYVLNTQLFYLFKDTNTGVLGPLVPQSKSTISNSQCALSGVNSGGSGGATDFSLEANIIMAPFSGTLNIYALAQSYTGANSGWQQAGMWLPPEKLDAVSSTPNTSMGTTQTFSAVYTDPNGVMDLQAVYLDFGASPTAPNSCIVVYVPYNNTLYLLNNDGMGASGPLTAGANGTPISNSQCTLAPGAVPTTMVNTLTVPFNITFAGTFTGPKNIYGLAQTFSGTQSPVEKLGTWTP